MARGVYPHKPLSEEHKRKLSEALKGRVFSEETRKKFSEAQRGNTKALGFKRSELNKQRISEALKGRASPLRGRQLSEEARRNQSEAQKARVAAGRNNLWRGGIYPINKLIRHSTEYKLWRESVFKRDEYKCVWCGAKGKLNADHIKPFALYPDLRFDTRNGRTLCVPCHRTTDTWGHRTTHLLD